MTMKELINKRKAAQALREAEVIGKMPPSRFEERAPAKMGVCPICGLRARAEEISKYGSCYICASGGAE